MLKFFVLQQEKCLCSLLTLWLRILWSSLEIPKVLKKLVKSSDSATQMVCILCSLQSMLRSVETELVVKQGIFCVLLFLCRFSYLEVEHCASLAIAQSQFNARTVAVSMLLQFHLIFTRIPKDTLDGCKSSKPPWNSWACRWCHVMIMSSAVMLLVLFAIMPCNKFFSVGNQAYLLLSYLLSAIKLPINLFSLVPMPFPLETLSSLVSSCFNLFFALLLLQTCHGMIQCSSMILTQRQWAIRMNLSYTIDYWSQQGKRQVDCQTNQPDVILYSFLPSLLFDCLLSDSQLMSCNALYPCWLLVVPSSKCSILIFSMILVHKIFWYLQSFHVVRTPWPKFESGIAARGRVSWILVLLWTAAN